MFTELKGVGTTPQIVDPPRPKSSEWEILRDEDDGVRVTLRLGKTSFGRGVESDITLKGDGVQRKHLTLEATVDGRLHMVNLAPVGDTQLNHRDCAVFGEYQLSDGDVILLGSHTLLWVKRAYGSGLVEK